MALQSDNILVVYRQFDSESEEAALRYQQIRGLSSSQLLAVPCSNREVLNSYAEFQSEVETPILDAIDDVYTPLTRDVVQAIVLMPMVPGGFQDGFDIISSTSRLSRIYFPYDSSEKMLLNPLYDRKQFKRFDNEDANSAIICTRIDSPLASITNQWFDNIERASKQLVVSGEFFFDAYSAFQGNDAIEYQEDLLSFRSDLLERSSLVVNETVQIDPYTDSFIGKVENDSFYWGWGSDRGSLSFFKTSPHIRGFFYNGDFDGAFSVRSLDDRTWPVLAIRQGYIATAGSMSNAGIEIFMRPIPFFDAIFRGATLGEAMLFAQPRLNSPIACFGDPLSRFIFPVPIEENDLIERESGWRSVNECFSESAIMMLRKGSLLNEVRSLIVSGTDEDVNEDLLHVFDRLGKRFPLTDWRNDYTNLAVSMFNYAVIRNQTNLNQHYPSIEDYLRSSNTKVTEISLEALYNSSTQISIPFEFKYKEGSWILEFELEHDPGSFAFYHFEFDVYSDADLTELVLSRDSFEDVTDRGARERWLFEKDPNRFQSIPPNGVTSNFAGRRVRYESDGSEGLERGRFYYFNVRQKDQLTFFPYRLFAEVIYR